MASGWPPTTIMLRRRQRPMTADEDSVAVLSNLLVVAISDAMVDMAVHDGVFRAGVHRAVLRSMAMLSGLRTPCMWEDLLPGFTVMAIPVTSPQAATPPAAVMETAAAGDPNVSSEAARGVAALMADAFVRRTGHRLIVLESPNLLLALFPVADQQRNLNEWGLSEEVEE